MADFSNSADRVLNILNKLSSMGAGDSALVVWSRTLGVSEEISRNDPHELQRKLGLLRNELDFLETSMSSTSFSELLYQPYIERIRKTVTVTNLDSSWGNFSNSLGADVILCIKYCAEILPSEPNVEFEELKELLSKISLFRKEIENSSLPKYTYQFVSSQIDIIQNAILDYPIKGGIAIKQAFSAGFSDVSDKADDLANDEVTEATSKVGGFWKDLKKAGDEFVATDRIVNAYIGLIDKGQGLANGIISYLLPGNGP